MIRPALINDLNQVAEVHIAAFPDFFLTLLGKRFLMTMYRAFLLNTGSAFVVSEVEGAIDGFAVGILKSSDADWYAALKYFPLFALALLLAIIRNPIALTRRIYAKLLGKGDRISVPANAIILRSIGVRPESQGKGTARKLIEKFEKIAQSKNATAVVLTTDANQNERAIKFYSSLGYQPVQEFRQNETRAMLLLMKNLSV